MSFEYPRGTGAGIDLVPADDAPGPADDAGTARMIVGTALINVRTHGYVPGTRRIEVSTRGDEG